MQKVMRIGQVETSKGRWCDLHIEATITKEGELSITGVIGALPSGNCVGGAGQIHMEFKHLNPAHDDKRTSHLVTPDEICFADGWTDTTWLYLLDVWHTWHLNHMKPGCEHMTGEEWNASKELTLYYFRTQKHVTDTIQAFKDRAMECLKQGISAHPSAEETRLALLPDKLTLWYADLADYLGRDYEANSPRYENDHYNKASEKKNAGWTRPEEHPGGLLCKPCPVCGYKYGSAWRKRELPQSVIDFLESLPVADKAPAWV